MFGFGFYCWFWGSNSELLLAGQALLHSLRCSPPTLAFPLGSHLATAKESLPCSRSGHSALPSSPWPSLFSLCPAAVATGRLEGHWHHIQISTASPRTFCLKQPTLTGHTGGTVPAAHTHWARRWDGLLPWSTALQEPYGNSTKVLESQPSQSVLRKVKVLALSTDSVPGWFCHRIL